MIGGRCAPCPAGANFEARNSFITGFTVVIIIVWMLCAFAGPVLFFRKIPTEDEKRARMDAALAEREQDIEHAKKSKKLKIAAGSMSEQAGMRETVC